MESKHDVCVALDKLLIDMLSLMEQKIQAQVNVEHSAKNGSIHLAKARYIMGQSSVSSIQLPTENTPEFTALTKVQKDRAQNDSLKFDQYNLVDEDKNDETNLSSVNPIKWFGVLVPQNLHRAQSMFGKVLEYIIESLNIEKHLQETCNQISTLKSLKEKLTPEE